MIFSSRHGLSLQEAQIQSSGGAGGVSGRLLIFQLNSAGVIRPSSYSTGSGSGSGAKAGGGGASRS